MGNLTCTSDSSISGDFFVGYVEGNYANSVKITNVSYANTILSPDNWWYDSFIGKLKVSIGDSDSVNLIDESLFN